LEPRKAETKNEELPKPLQRQNSASSAKTNEKAPPAKKEKSSLFNSFAKAKPKPKKEDSATPAASAAESVSLYTLFLLQFVLTNCMIDCN
jgi:DNA polymerase delta subunit 3